MLFRKPFAAVLLLVAAFAGPQLLWLGAHAIEHHGHAEWSDLAQTLVHGHEHEEGTPEHEHRLLPSPTLRLDAPRDLQAPALAAALEGMDAGQLLLSPASQQWKKIRLTGSSPPRLHLLGALLI